MLNMLVLLAPLALSCSFGIAQKIELSSSGDCPQTKDGQLVSIDGYFGIDPKEGVGIAAGYEGNHPYGRFAFSAEPGSKTELSSGLVWANEGANRPGKANRMELERGSDAPRWHLYDNQRGEIGFSDRVRVTRPMIEPCIVKWIRLKSCKGVHGQKPDLRG